MQDLYAYGGADPTEEICHVMQIIWVPAGAMMDYCRPYNIGNIFALKGLYRS